MSEAEPAVGPRRVTVGVVIDLPEPHATVIDRWRARSGDFQAGRIAPHITLLPPTPVEESELDGVLEHLGKVAAANPVFPLHLSGTDSFRPVSQVAFVRVADGAQQCADLEAAVRSGPLGHPRDYPYRPHVTIAHDVDGPALDDACAGLSDFVARFPVEGFSLYLRSQGSWTFAGGFRLPGRPTDGPADLAAGDLDEEPPPAPAIDPTASC